jgi:hypothetical protein
MKDINELIKNLKEIKNLYTSAIYVLENGEHELVVNLLKHFENDYKKTIKELEDDKTSFNLDMAKLAVNYALDFNNKEAFIVASEEYNRLKKISSKLSTICCVLDLT